MSANVTQSPVLWLDQHQHHAFCGQHCFPVFSGMTAIYQCIMMMCASLNLHFWMNIMIYIIKVVQIGLQRLLTISNMYLLILYFVADHS